MSKYKKVILLPDRVTQSVFDLPCVTGIFKDDEGGMFYFITIHNTDENTDFVYHVEPGIALAEDNNGNWWLLSQKDYEEWKEQNNVITLKRIEI